MSKFNTSLVAVAPHFAVALGLFFIGSVLTLVLLSPTPKVTPAPAVPVLAPWGPTTEITGTVTGHAATMFGNDGYAVKTPNGDYSVILIRAGDRYYKETVLTTKTGDLKTDLLGQKVHVTGEARGKYVIAQVIETLPSSETVSHIGTVTGVPTTWSGNGDCTLYVDGQMVLLIGDPSPCNCPPTKLTLKVRYVCDLVDHKVKVTGLRDGNIILALSVEEL